LALGGLKVSDYVAYIVFGAIWFILVVDVMFWAWNSRKASHLPEEEKDDYRKIADVILATDMVTIFVMGSVLTISLLVGWAMNRWEAFFNEETFLNITIGAGMSTLWILYFWYLMIRHSVEAKIASLFLTDKQTDIIKKSDEESKENIAKWKAKLGFKAKGD
jgi:prolipoprotein diacylglyceryltransferase